MWYFEQEYFNFIQKNTLKLHHRLLWPLCLCAVSIETSNQKTIQSCIWTSRKYCKEVGTRRKCLQTLWMIKQTVSTTKQKNEIWSKTSQILKKWGNDQWWDKQETHKRTGEMNNTMTTWIKQKTRNEATKATIKTNKTMTNMNETVNNMNEMTSKMRNEWNEMENA